MAEEESGGAPPPVDLSEGFKVPSWASSSHASSSAVVLEMKEGHALASLPVGAREAFTFGRSAEACDHALVHGSASRRHGAVLHDAEGAAYVVDLKSSHGTRVNGRRAEPGVPVRISDGDTFSFGASSRTYVYHAGGMPEGVKLRAPAAAPPEASSREKRRREGGSSSSSSSKRKRPADDGRKVRCSHLLVKHAGSRRPSSWKEKVITRTLEEATAMVEGFRAQILADVEAGKGDLATVFARLATTESHCSSAKRGGDLGSFGRRKMQPAFEDASFALAVGEMSKPVVSQSGVHIIYRAA